MFKHEETSTLISLVDLKRQHKNISFPTGGPTDEWLSENGYSRYAEEPLNPVITLVNELADIRWKHENGGVQVNTGNGIITVQSDRETRANLIGARIEAKENPAFELMWKTVDGFKLLSANMVIYLADMVLKHVVKCYKAEAEVLVLIQQEPSAYSNTLAIYNAYMNAYNNIGD